MKKLGRMYSLSMQAHERFDDIKKKKFTNNVLKNGCMQMVFI